LGLITSEQKLTDKFLSSPSPPFCLGKGLFFAFNAQFFELFSGKPLSAFSPEIMLYEVIFLAVEAVAYTGLAILLDKMSSNPEAMLCLQKLCCRKSSERSAVAATPDDDDVVAEQKRVLDGQANGDAIVMSELTKVYPNGKKAVDQLSLGIAPGRSSNWRRLLLNRLELF